MDSWTPCILGKVWFTTPRCSPIDICPTWERENEEKLTIKTSQAASCSQQQSTVNFSSFSLSHVRKLSMGLHLGVVNRTFPKILGVQESKTFFLKKAQLSGFSPFSRPSKFLQMLCRAHVLSGVHDMYCYTPNKTNQCRGSTCQRVLGLVNI